MDWGAREEWLESLSKDLGRPLPALQTKPEIPDDLVWFWKIYHDLANRRQYTGFGTPCPISISELLAYCEFYEINSLDIRDMLLALTSFLESEYFKIQAEKSRLKSAPPIVKGSPGGRRPH